MNPSKVSKLLLVISLQFFAAPVYPQVPTADYFGRWLSKTSSVVQQASQFLKETAAPLVDTFKKTQKFFKSAQVFVNHTVKNLRYIEMIISLYKDIKTTFDKAIIGLNAPKDTDDDGMDDLDFLDKWKHAQILLAISTESTSVFEMLSNILEEDAFTMDDKGRIQILKETYTEMLKLKRAMSMELRRINAEIFQYRKLKKEQEVFESLFSVN